MPVTFALTNNDGGRVALVGSEIRVASSLAGSAGNRSFTVRVTDTATGAFADRVVPYQVLEALRNLSAAAGITHLGMQVPFDYTSHPDINMVTLPRQVANLTLHVMDGHNCIDASGNANLFTNWTNAKAAADALSLGNLTRISPAWPKASAFGSGYVPSAANWKQCISGFATAIASQPGTSTIPYVRAVNEVIDRTQPDGADATMFRAAAAADSAWTASGLSPRMWWLYSAAQMAAVVGAGTRLFFNDYNFGAIDGGSIAWGGATTPTGMVAQSSQLQRFYWAIDQLHEAMTEIARTGAGQPAGPGGIIQGARIDAAGVQSHYNNNVAFVPDDAIWQLWELNALELRTALTEVNCKLNDVTGFGIADGSGEARVYASHLTAWRVWLGLRYSECDFVDFWTRVTDQGDGAHTLFEANRETNMVPEIVKVFQSIAASGRDARRGAMTLFGAAGPALLPPQIRDGAGVFGASAQITANATGSHSIHATLPMFMPHSRYRRRVSGVFQSFSAQSRSVKLGFLRSANSASIANAVLYREVDASGNPLIELRFTGSNGDLSMFVNGSPTGTVLARITNNHYGAVSIRVSGGQIKAAVSTWTSAGGHVAATGVTTVTATIADVARYEFTTPQAGVTNRIQYHGLWDTGFIPADDAALIADSQVMIGQPVSYEQIIAWEAP
jgi:hypothetical protein